MEMSEFRVESHVAQKSRRDKLRIQHNSDQNQHLEDYTNSMEHISVHHQALGPSSKYESLSYDPNVFSPEILSYVARTSQQFLPQNDALVNADHQESASTQFDRPNSSVAFAHPSHQNSPTWKSVVPLPSCDWTVNYQKHCPIGGDQGSSNNFSSSSLYAKPSSMGYQHDLDSYNISQKQVYGETHFGSSSIYQTNLQKVVTPVSLGQPHMNERGMNSSNELLLLPAYGNQSKTLHFNNDPRWVSTSSVGGYHQGNANSNYVNVNDSSTQGLSLSLSSVPKTEDQIASFGGRGDSQDLINDISGSKGSNVDSKGFTGSKNVESTRHNAVGTSSLARSTGPLGPFTGYATILTSSKFLKPAQELLSESCLISSQEHIQICEANSHKDSEDIIRTKGGESGASSSAFYGSNDNISGEAGDGGRSSSDVSYRPEFQQKKAKLLYMQDEICRRYKQYHQQMEMVVSSFESVAGLSSATPYISLALKAVKRHFGSLKNVITVQLKHTRKALGEDLSSPTTGMASSIKGDNNTTTSRVRAFDHSFQKYQKSSGGGGGGGFLESQQPVWRPQRGLPERAVSVLRAWLFDHFLHPYPTDTDKHMLATQTGLTRNQVSNWFINARVRVWKPMVEEIHTLETKAMEEPNSNAGSQMDTDEIPRGRLLNTNSIPSNMQGESSNTVTLARVGPGEAEAGPGFWNRDMRSRTDIQTSMDGSFFGFEPYHQRGVEMGQGLGAVSLTLGLRQSAENAQQHKQQLQNEVHQLRQQFGGHIYKYS